MAARHPESPSPAADRGLVALGLLLQLAGTVFAAAAMMAGATALLRHGEAGTTGWLFVVGAASVARSLALRGAGTAMVYGTRPAPGGDAPSDERRLAGARRYIAVALAHTALVAAIANAVFAASVTATLVLAGGLVLWPAVLGVLVTRPAWRALEQRLPVPPDRGFEAVAILLTVFGLGGLTLSLALLGYVLDQPLAQLEHGPSILILLLLVVLVVRGALQAQAGIAGLRETSIERAVQRATRYANFGAISTFCVSGPLMLAATMSSASLAGVAVVAGIAWMLMTWPLLVRRFFSDRHFEELLEGDDAPRHHRAPDVGHGGLGWLLAGNAAVGATWLLLRGAVALAPALEALPIARGAEGAPLLQAAAFALGGLAAHRLVGGRAHARLVTAAWAVATVASAAVLVGPELAAGDLDLRHVAGTPWWVAQLVLVAITLVLITRRVAPTARARYRPARGS